MHQLSDFEMNDSTEETFCLNWTKHDGMRKVCVNFHTDTVKLNIVVYRNRNNLNLKDKEVDLKMSQHQLPSAKRVHLLSYIDIFYKRCIVLEETTVHN